MGQSQYTSLLAALAVVSDPRKAHGKRFAWNMLLTLTAADLASGHQTAHVIAQWVAFQATTLRLIDVAVLE